MGKRRIRNLKALGLTDIAGVDPRGDRRDEAAGKYDIATFANFAEALSVLNPSLLVISTSPEKHMQFAFEGLRHGLPCFIEASVVDSEGVLKLHEATVGRGPIMAPSCTMRYFPGPIKVKDIVRSGVLGKILSFNYQTGQYLRDWHPWEDISDYYVSRRETGGAREIVPFELTWLDEIFGSSVPIRSLCRNIGDLGVDIDDIYYAWLRYPGGVLANITIEVLSRPQATRELRVTGSSGQLVFNADNNLVRVATVEEPAWKRYELSRGRAEAGYINPEEPYVREMSDFLEAVRSGDQSKFPNNLLDDYRILQTLTALEKLSEEGVDEL
jgi:predicted dehydrogenase